MGLIFLIIYSFFVDLTQTPVSTTYGFRVLWLTVVVLSPTAGLNKCIPWYDYISDALDWKKMAICSVVGGFAISSGGYFCLKWWLFMFFMGILKVFQLRISGLSTIFSKTTLQRQFADYLQLQYLPLFLCSHNISLLIKASIGVVVIGVWYTCTALR